MVRLNQRGSEDPGKYDLSFMASYRCDLRCSFCMYDCGPDAVGFLDIGWLESWLKTVDMDLVASFGVYGGEPSVVLDHNTKIMDLVAPYGKPHFVITNGAWSADVGRTLEFLAWCSEYRTHIVVSGTPEHREHQNRHVLEGLAKQCPESFTLKPLEENFHAMGRLKGKIPFSCTSKCQWWDRALRIAVNPEGNILFQNCDGEYPRMGDISEPFHRLHHRVQEFRQGRDTYGYLFCRHWGKRGEPDV